MNRHVVTLTLLLISTFTLAQKQVIKGLVMASTDSTPIAYAQIYFEGTLQGTASNSLGEFELVVPEQTESNAKIVFEALPYRPVVVNYNKLTSAPVTIFMTKESISKGGRLDKLATEKVVKSAISKVAKNYHQQGMKETFHREYVSSFDNVIQYFEANIKTEFSANKITDTHLTDAFFVEDKREKDFFYQAGRGGFYTFGWNEFNADNEPASGYFLSLRMKPGLDVTKYYDFFSPGTIRFEERSVYVIHFDQLPSIKAALLKGTLFIDSVSNAILKITYSLSPKGSAYILPNRSIRGVRICKPPMKLEIVKESGELNFRRFANKYFPANEIIDRQFNASFDTTTSPSHGKHFLKLRSEKLTARLDTSSLHTDEKTSVKGLIIDTEYIKKNFENYDKTRATWRDANTIKATTSAETLVEKLKRNNAIWEKKESRKAYAALMKTTHFDAQQLRQDLNYLVQTFNALHPSLQELSVRSHFERMIAYRENRISRPMFEAEFLKELSPIIESLHCGHTQLHPSAATTAYNQQFGKFFPFSITTIGRRAYLTEGVADTARGSEIISINGSPIATILQNIRYKASTEGLSAIGKDAYIGKNFPFLYAMIFEQPDTFRIEYKGWQNHFLYQQNFAARPQPISQSKPASILKEIDSLQTIVLNPPGDLSDSSYRAFFEKVFTMIHVRNFSNLVLDLRDNPNFDEEQASILYSYFTSQPSAYFQNIMLASADTTMFGRVLVAERKLRNIIPSFVSNIARTDTGVYYNNHPGLTQINTNKNKFVGNVYVLINSFSSFSAVDFAKFLQLQNRAFVIGTENYAPFHGNCTGKETSIILPNTKIRITFPVAAFHPTNTSTNDHQLIPDHAVQYNISDIVSRTDKEMDSCLQVIVQNCCSAKSN